MSEQKRDQGVEKRLAFLHCEYLGRRESLKFQKKYAPKDNAITFLYDTGVLNAFSRPWKVGPLDPDGKQHGFGQIFPRSAPPAKEETQNHEAKEDFIAWLVCQGLARKALDASRVLNNNDEPIKTKIYQFNTHHKETNIGFSKVERLSRKKGEPRETLSGQTVKKILAVAFHKVMENNGTQDVEIVRWLERATALLVQTTTNDHAIRAQAERIEDLKDRYGERQAFTEQKFTELVNDKTVDAEGGWQKKEASHKFIAVEEDARTILEKHFSACLEHKGKSQERKDTDVDALVDLAIWNRRLLELEINHRLVFVTADRNLVANLYDVVRRNSLEADIARVVRKKERDGAFADNTEMEEFSKGLHDYFGFNKKKYIENWLQHFSFRFVRHFWAVLPDAAFETSDTVEFGDVLHGHFANISDRLRLSRHNIERLAYKLHRGKEAQYEKSNQIDNETTWQKLSLLVAKRERLLYFGNSLEILKQSPHEVLKEPAEKLEKLVEEIISRHRDRYMIGQSDAGTRALFEEENHLIYPIDMSFQTQENTNTVFQRLQNGIYTKGHSKHNFHDDFSRIDSDAYGSDTEDDFDDRQRSYLKFVALAALYATHQKWAAAIGHAERALNVITRRKDVEINKKK